MTDSILASRREVSVETHAAIELNTARRIRRELTALATRIENDPSRMSWFAGYDKADVVELLRDIADFSDSRVEDIAADEAVDLINERV